MYGLGLTIGNTEAGRLSDWKPMPTIIGMLALLTPVMGSFYIRGIVSISEKNYAKKKI
ncbi:hypothetical protein V7457_27070 [Bacillus toyonensis]|uniref:hypothetical protein n=1 Tax=Bacillus TaxID=1386 RepID=UPI00039E1AAF|nr:MULTISPECIES: hypothetical protein [Bacillus cereus group]MBJ8043935.1 hypothetical protein [Bacillus cereus group sp. N17]MCU5304702.1 hypothetical protein [Bacillus toyonensis]MCU5726524.1 hypothetical protein [Bacillus toyonensis]MDD9264306.1 hypothetical protein [Bacillus toyonensis]